MTYDIKLDSNWNLIRILGKKKKKNCLSLKAIRDWDRLFPVLGSGKSVLSAYVENPMKKYRGQVS